MNWRHSLLAIAMSTVFVSQVQAADAAKQAVVDSLANNLVVKYEVVTNDGAGAGLDCQTLTAWHYGGDEAKNIMQGCSYQDPAVTKKEELVAWKGNVDFSKQDKPFGKSPMCQKMIADSKIKDVAEMPVYFAKEVGVWSRVTASPPCRRGKMV